MKIMLNFSLLFSNFSMYWESAKRQNIFLYFVSIITLSFLNNKVIKKPISWILTFLKVWKQATLKLIAYRGLQFNSEVYL